MSSSSIVPEKNSWIKDLKISMYIFLYYLLYSKAKNISSLAIETDKTSSLSRLFKVGIIMFVTALHKGQYIFYFYLEIYRKQSWWTLWKHDKKNGLTP